MRKKRGYVSKKRVRYGARRTKGGKRLPKYGSSRGGIRL